MKYVSAHPAFLPAVSPSLLSSFGRASSPPGGLGAKPPNVVNGDWVPDPMLAQPRKPPISKETKTPLTRSKKGNQLNNTDKKLAHNTPLKIRPLPLLLIIAPCFLSISCSSQRHKHTSVMNLLNSEETLLRSIEGERSNKSIKQRIERDQTLLEAEFHLREAIRALFEANHAVKRAL